MEEAFADCGEVLSINWFEEKETKKFMGAGVVEFESSEAAGGGRSFTPRRGYDTRAPLLVHVFRRRLSRHRYLTRV